MDVFAILGLVGGLFGILAFGRVNRLSKQIYLLRSDVKLATVRNESSGGGSCGCGGNC